MNPKTSGLLNKNWESQWRRDGFSKLLVTVIIVMNSWRKGQGFDSHPMAITVFLWCMPYICTSPRSIIWYIGGAVVLWSWEGNQRSGVVLAMRRQSSWYILWEGRRAPSPVVLLRLTVALLPFPQFHNNLGTALFPPRLWRRHWTDRWLPTRLICCGLPPKWPILCRVGR